jgi:hypothetical protein
MSTQVKSECATVSELEGMSFVLLQQERAELSCHIRVELKKLS